MAESMGVVKFTLSAASTESAQPSVKKSIVPHEKNSEALNIGGSHAFQIKVIEVPAVRTSLDPGGLYKSRRRFAQRSQKFKGYPKLSDVIAVANICLHVSSFRSVTHVNEP